MAYTTINKSTEYFDTKLYSGNGATGSGQTITGLNFKPDMTWVKSRNTTDGHTLQDAARGFGLTTKLSPYDNSAQNDSNGGSYGNYGYQSAATSNGFTMVAGSVPGQNNKSGNTYSSFNWKAGTTSGIATDGNSTITPSSYSFNQTNGFSVITYTGNGTSGAGIPHGLNKKPQFYIVKRLDTTGSWQVFTQPNINTSNATKYLILNDTNAEASNTNRWNGYQPSTTNFYLGNSTEVNASGGTYVAYAFANIKGFSKVGSYIGNGSADGPFIYTGFKPGWLLIKKTSAAGNGWFQMDTKRDLANPNSTFFQLNLTNAETASDRMDILSNGFKPRYNWGIINDTSATYIYMAFAEAPLVGTNNVPCTAR